jgi:hypothetical protein
VPAGGQAEMVDESCGIFVCDGTFKASVNSARRGSVSGFTWFDDRGRRQSNVWGPQHDTMKLSSGIGLFKIMLRTNGKHGEYRYSVWKCGHRHAHRYCERVTDQ